MGQQNGLRSGPRCLALIALALDACIRGLLLLTDPSRRT